jgi:hypothetical protein
MIDSPCKEDRMSCAEEKGKTMKKKTIIELTNKISLVAILLLLYWVFIFIVNTVFKFKVFQENITESFYLSVMGILAILGGAVIVNVMYNMTIISEALGQKIDEEKESKKKPDRVKWTIIFALSFPVIAGLLYLGDLRTSGAKERQIVKSAKYMMKNNKEDLEGIGNYSFDSVYVGKTIATLNLLSQQDEDFPTVHAIVRDSIYGKEHYLRFGGWYYGGFKNEKANYIYSCSSKEREYLKEVFEGKSNKHYFSAHDGNFELYHPVKTKNRIIVLYFTDYQRYGKSGYR